MPSLRRCVLFQFLDSFQVFRFSDHDQDIAVLDFEVRRRHDDEPLRHQLFHGDDVNVVAAAKIDFLERSADK